MNKGGRSFDARTSRIFRSWSEAIRRFMSPKLENTYPTLGGLISAIAALVLLKVRFFSPCRSSILQGYGTLLPAALNISAIAVGFLATSQSILLSLSRSRAVRLMKASGHYRRLLTFLNRAISTSFLWAILTAWLSTLHLLLGGAWRLAAVCFWTYLCACSILCYYRATSILTDVMRDEEQPARTGSPVSEWKAADDLTS